MSAINDRVRVKRTFVNPASSGSNEVIAALTNNAIRVLSLALVSTSANTVKFMSAATDITAANALAANGGLVLPYMREGWFETASGEALNINLTASAQVGVTITYEVI